MKAFVGALLGLFLFGVAQAQSPVLPGPGLPVASGGSPPVPTYIGEVAATNGGTNMTASAVPIGTASASRRVIVVVSYDVNTSPTAVSSGTIGGVSATIHATAVDVTSSNSGVAILSAIVPSGTTATIVANGPAIAGVFGVYTVDNSTLVSGTPTTGTFVYTGGGGATTFNTSLSASAGGFVISAWDTTGGAAASPYTTPSATQNFTTNNTAIFSQTGLASGTITPGITISGSNVAAAMASASWR